MLTTEAHIETDRPSRYLVQFCRHANQMSHHHRRHLPRTRHGGDTHERDPEMRNVDWSDTHGTVDLNWGRCTMHATSDTLTVRAEAPDEENLRRIQNLLTGRLEHFGRRDHLTVTWQQPPNQERKGAEDR